MRAEAVGGRLVDRRRLGRLRRLRLLVPRAELLAGGLDPFDAASVGSWVHGAAATLATRRGPIDARFYRPSGHITRTALLIPGIHSMGIEEPRLKLNAPLTKAMLEGAKRLVTRGTDIGARIRLRRTVRAFASHDWQRILGLACHVGTQVCRDLGATPGSDGTGFRVWAPTARDVSLCLYDDGDGAASARLPMQRDDATGTWSTRLPGDRSGDYYTYLVDVFVPGTGVVRNRVTDPYSVSLTADSKRSYVADLEAPALKPAGWDDTPRPAPLAAPTDMVIYELHVRDFSRDDTTVTDANRGKYLAFTETRSDGMRHLRSLADAGLTDVHLLPVFDLATVPESGCVEPDVPEAAADSQAQQAAVMAVAARDCFNWGYDPYHFNAPEGSFASTALHTGHSGSGRPHPHGRRSVDQGRQRHRRVDRRLEPGAGGHALSRAHRRARFRSRFHLPRGRGPAAGRRNGRRPPPPPRGCAAGPVLRSPSRDYRRRRCPGSRPGPSRRPCRGRSPPPSDSRTCASACATACC